MPKLIGTIVDYCYGIDESGKNKLSWQDAADYCVLGGAHLTVIDSAAEYTALRGAHLMRV